MAALEDKDNANFLHILLNSEIKSNWDEALIKKITHVILVCDHSFPS